MKLIEALKNIDALHKKADDISDKIHRYCANYTHESAPYGETQREQIDQWTQAHGDICNAIAKLYVCIQRTNTQTPVTITLGDKQVTKSIAEWIIRRRFLSEKQLNMWRRIGDRNLQEGYITTSSGEKKDVKIRRYYDPRVRDEMVEMYRSEPSTIDSTLEMVNAVTDLIEE